MNMKKMDGTQTDVDWVFSPDTVRLQAGRLFELASSGGTGFEVCPENLDVTTDIVEEVIRSRFSDPDAIPFHSRWSHFNAGGSNRTGKYRDKIRALPPEEQVRSQLDLVVTSVLLDAGAGDRWKFQDEGKSYSRSEGLAIASLRAFESGLFSSSPQTHPFQADAMGLQALTLEKLSEAFQLSPDNAIPLFENRLALLQALGKAVDSNSNYFKNRPGDLFFTLKEQSASRGAVPARAILLAVQKGLGNIWPGRLEMASQNLGDTWFYGPLKTEKDVEGLIPFHKLSQWLTYSMIEPIQKAGLPVEGISELTGLAEYRNGGLILDTGLIQFRNAGELAESFPVSSDRIVEWRALTIHCLDLIGNEIRRRWNKTPEELPLVKILEGGTWHAGRKLANEKRQGNPPIKIQLEGTVF